MMTDADILKDLQTAAIAAVAASTMPSLPIAPVDITFVVPDDQKYLELVFIPNNPPDACWGDESTYAGMFRLILHWPNNSEGSYIPMRLLASICGYFTKGLTLPNAKISDKPKVLTPLAQGSENLYPASVQYRRFVP